MAKKNKKTFAQRAKDIEKKYPRAKFDPIEKRDLEAELEALMQEQEAVRESMGMNQPQEQFAGGGKMKYPTGGFMMPTDLQNQFMSLNTPASSFGTPDIANPYQPIQQDLMGGYSMTPMSSSEISDLQKQAKKATPTGVKIGDIGRNISNNENLPYYASGVSNIASNLLLANMAKRNQPRYSPTTATPERINLEPQAEALRRQAATTKNINMANARNLGLNAGATMSNVGAANVGVDRALGDTLTNLYMGQEQANVGTANQLALANMQATNQGRMFDAQLQGRNLENQLGYMSGALGTIPGVMKDIRMDKADAEMRDVMNSYYKSLGGNNYATVGDIFSKNGFKWEVTEVDDEGKPVRMVKRGRTKK